MNHISYEKWLQYTRGELDSATQKKFEDHLYGCDQCLSVYLEAVETEDQQLPVMSNEDIFTDLIMQEIESQKQVAKPQKQSFYQKAAFHYFVAAAMTIILMTSGVFSHLTNALNEFEANKKKEPSVVIGLMNKSVSLIDKVEKHPKEGKK